jgi:hypothetical protein
MPEAELSLLFVRPLNSLGVRYFVGGSVAATMYGEPRLTADVDIVVVLRFDDLARLETIFPEPAYYCPPPDVIAVELARLHHGHFNVLHVDSGFKADFYPAGRDELNAWGFRNARRLQYRGEPMMVAPPEYVIVRKLEYFKEGGSEKHLRDIRSMLTVSRELLNVAAIEEWVQRRGVSAEWGRVRS